MKEVDTKLGRMAEKEAEDDEIYEEYNISAKQFDAVLTQTEIQCGLRSADGSPAKNNLSNPPGTMCRMKIFKSCLW